VVIKRKYKLNKSRIDLLIQMYTSRWEFKFRWRRGHCRNAWIFKIFGDFRPKELESNEILNFLFEKERIGQKSN